jgi:SpoVK/Ycf46/Vps4 family AAA+-type ATPase
MISNMSAFENLLRTGASGDKAGFKAVIDQLLQEAETKGDATLAKLLQSSMQGGEKGSIDDRTDKDAISKAFDKRLESTDDIPIGLQWQKTNATLDTLILKPETVEIIRSVIEEQHDFQIFLDAGLKPRHKLLLIGPPGNGKTQATKAFANAMGLPLYFVRYDALISQRPGETSKRLNTIFEFAKSHRCILFFDEIDAIGKERSDPNETAEMKRVVSTLLVQLDDVPPHVICMGATNHASLLDRAFLRRFDIRIMLPNPGVTEYAKYLDMAYNKWGLKPNRNLRVLGISLQVENFAEAEIFVDDCIRTWVKARKEISIDEAIDRTLIAWPKSRVKIPM